MLAIPCHQAQKAAAKIYNNKAKVRYVGQRKTSEISTSLQMGNIMANTEAEEKTNSLNRAW